jgi:hypothetical protein
MFAIDVIIVGHDSNIIYYCDTYTLIKAENTSRRSSAVTTIVILFITLIA